MRLIRRAMPLLAVTIFVLGTATPASAPAAGAKAARAKHHRQSLFWGGSFGGASPWDWTPVANFESMIRKTISVVDVGAPFQFCGSNGCSFVPFPTHVMRQVRSHGVVPFLSWSSGSFPQSGIEPDFTDRKVTSGAYDSYIRSFAEGAKNWGHPFFLRFDWEMNGTWWPWATGSNGNHTADFVALWRHVHHIFTQVGARNATWVWCPNVDPGRYYTDVRKLYPGSSYVDWTCLDGYNWGSTGPGSPGARRGGWLGFDHLFRRTYNEITHIAPSKSMILGEVGSSSHGGNRGSWIANMLKRLPTSYRHIHGFLWYDVNDGWSFQIGPGSGAEKAFSRGIRTRAFARNVFCRERGKIGAPRYPAPLHPFCSRW